MARWRHCQPNDEKRITASNIHLFIPSLLQDYKTVRKEDPSKIRFCTRRPDFEISPTTQLSLSFYLHPHPSIDLNFSLSLLLLFVFLFLFFNFKAWFTSLFLFLILLRSQIRLCEPAFSLVGSIFLFLIIFFFIFIFLLLFYASTIQNTRLLISIYLLFHLLPFFLLQVSTRSSLLFLKF